MIHPTAIVHPHAQLHPSVVVGPFAVIDEHVAVGPDCRIGAHVHLTGHTTIGAGNVFHTGCVIGDAPQDLKYRDEPTRLRIGDRNVFREHVTVHRANKETEDTVIGSHNFLMVNCHVGHNAQLGDHVIVANGALLAGHVQVADRVFISGNCLAHQFVRIGTLALMQGGSAISKDLPPYTVARGVSSEQRLELKRAYHALFRSGRPLRNALHAARKEFASEHARVLLDFVAASKRGVCADVGQRRDAGEAD